MRNESFHRVSRRTFSAASLAAGVSLVVHPNASPGDAPADGWIDAHTHVWTDDLTRYPIAEGYAVSSMQPARFTPEDLFPHTKPAGVERIVLIQMSYYGFDNSYMTDMIARYPGVFSGVAIIDPTKAGIADRMRELARRGVRGFRLYPPSDQKTDWTTDEQMLQLWKSAREQDLAVCLLINPSDLTMVREMGRLVPGTRIVIDHFARIGISGKIDSASLDRICDLATNPDVFVKISAFYALGKKQAPYDDLVPMIRRLLDAYGPSRLMWASDNPYQVQTPHRYVDSLALIRDRIAFLSPGDKEYILRKTAEGVYFRTY